MAPPSLFILAIHDAQDKHLAQGLSGGRQGFARRSMNSLSDPLFNLMQCRNVLCDLILLGSEPILVGSELF